MERRNVRDFWLFWHDRLFDTFDVVAAVDRLSFDSTAGFYHDVLVQLSAYCAAANDALDYLEAWTDGHDPKPEVAAEVSAELFLSVAKTLPHPYFIGVDDGFEYFIIAKSKDGVAKAPKPVIRRGKWLLVDDITRERFTPVAVTRLYCEPTEEYRCPLERSYRSAIAALLNWGAKVTYINGPGDIWRFPYVTHLHDAFNEAVRTLPKPYRIGIGDDLLRFYVLKPL